MEEVERVGVVGLHPVAGHAHHQHEVHEAVGGVAGQVQALEADLAAAAFDVAVRDPLHGLAVELRVGAVLAELTRPAELEREVTGADDRDPLVALPRLDHLADRLAQLDEPLRLRQRRREDVGVDRHDRQVGLRPQRDDRAGDAVVDPQLVAERQVEVAVETAAQDVGGELLVAGQRHPREAELALLVVPVGVEVRRLADQELRHVVQPQLVEVVTTDHHEHVGLGAGQRLAEGLDLGLPLVGERRSLGARGGAGLQVEGVVRRGDDRGDGGHARSSLLSPRSGRRRRRCGRWSGRRPSRSGAVAPRRAGRAGPRPGPAARSRATARPAGRGRRARRRRHRRR